MSADIFDMATRHAAAEWLRRHGQDANAGAVDRLVAQWADEDADTPSRRTSVAVQSVVVGLRYMGRTPVQVLGMDGRTYELVLSDVVAPQLLAAAEHVTRQIADAASVVASLRGAS